MNIRMAAVAACALTLGITPAAADAFPSAAELFTITVTFTATPNVVQVGETVILDLAFTLIPDLVENAAENVIVFGMASAAYLLVYDGVSGSPLRPTVGGGSYLDLSPNRPDEYMFAVSYDAPGTYFPTFETYGGLISVERVPNNGDFIHHFGADFQGSASISVIPGPVVGTGLPGLVLALGSGLAWWRRRQMATNS